MNLVGAGLPAVVRILVPIDLSPSARAALEYAALLAVGFGAELVVLHVWQPAGYAGPDTLAFVPAGEGRSWEERRGDVLREVDRLLEQQDVKPRQLEVRVEAGEPADTILQVAKERGVDLIVIGTHGRTGISRFLLGSVAEVVSRRSPCPVLMLRVPSKTSRAPGAQ
jgi:nucleotide-binding universal stress UspA family protein